MSIRYTHARLEQALGGPIDEIPETEYLKLVTARVYTASVNSDPPEDRFSNGLYWVTDAYKEGVRQGAFQERAQWQNKIKKLFGLT